MQRQYREFREKLPAGTVLLFRLGDFYEVFGEDAVVALQDPRVDAHQTA